MWLSQLVGDLLVLAVLVVAGIGLPWLSKWRADRGLGVSLPTFVRPPGEDRPRGHGGSGREISARAIVDGDHARIVGTDIHLLVPLHLWRRTSVQRRYEHGTKVFGAVTQDRMYDPSGRPWFVGIPHGWRRALDARRRTRPLRRWTRWRLAGPRWIGVVVGMLILVPLPFHALWWTGSDQTATVVRVGEHKAEAKCLVEWQEEDGRHTAWDAGCLPEFAGPGDREQVRVLGWPFKDLVMDDLTLEMVSVLCWFPAGVLSLIGRLVGWWRVRRPPVELVGTGIRPWPRPSVDDQHAPVLDLWDRCAEVEGWFDEEPTDPPRPWGRIIQAAALASHWWFIGVTMTAIGLIGFDPLWPMAVVGLAVSAYPVTKGVRVARAMQAAQSSPTRASWPYLTLRTPQNTWLVLLVQDGEPVWQVDLGGPQHPVVAGTVEVRGALEDGGRVVLMLDGEGWHPLGPVTLVDPGAPQVRGILLRLLNLTAR